MADANFFQQTKSFFSNLALWQKVMIIASPVVIIATLVLLIASGSEKEYSVLYSSLEQQDASKIVESLKSQQIKYKIADGGSTILVEKDKMLEARINLAGEGLPESGIVGYELFDKTNLGMSEFVQKLNYRRALEGELSKTISSIDEVQKARVHLVIPDKALFQKDQKKPTASVTLRLKSGKSLNQRTVSGIQTMVASSIEGMNTDDVSIVDQKGKLLSEAPNDITSVAGLTAQQLEQQRKVEEHLTAKVQSMLDRAIGVDNSNVRVTAELDFTQIEQTKTDYDPDRQVIRSEQTIAGTNKSSDSLSYPAVNMDQENSNIISNYEIAQTVEHIIHSTGGVKRLSVAAMINGTYTIADSSGTRFYAYIPRSDEEINKMTEIIKNAIGFDPSRNDQISVLGVQFDTIADELEPLTVREALWYDDPDNRKLIVLAIAMIIAFLIMYRLLQSKQVKERMRIAMELPQKFNMELEEEIEEVQDRLEDLDIDENDMLLLPADLPEQFLLEGERDEKMLERGEPAALLDDSSFDKTSLAERARVQINEAFAPKLTEDAMMKIELKNKVEEYLDEQTEDAIRLIRLLISQDRNA
ncbi:MAG: flagellar M-ring protein FliF [Desulfobulbaceae bacterium]|nr:flagellar M-ring protein FliF [Desulfobulbaceae bacterium]